MKSESKFYNEIKKNINQISWLRLENSVALGTPDLLGYTINNTFFTVELKVSKGNIIQLILEKLDFRVRHNYTPINALFSFFLYSIL